MGKQERSVKHTSGKWVVRQEGTDHIYWRVYNSNGQVVINTAFDKEIAEQIVRDHNTAPTLLEALEKALKVLELWSGSTEDKSIIIDIEAIDQVIKLLKAV